MLKGATTVIAMREEVTLNITGCDAMATGGSGDVLTGMIAALLAQGMSPYDAARAGAFCHGRAGEMAQRETGARAVTAADIMRCIKGARERGLTLRTSIIVGFPGETEEQFEELLEVLREAEFDRLGAFAYSPEEDTPAARLPDQIPDEVKQARLDRLMTMQAEVSLKRNQARVGTVEKVLVTAVGEDGYILGRSHREAPETDGEILFTANGDVPEVGSFVNVRITRADTYDLMGEIV